MKPYMRPGEISIIETLLLDSVVQNRVNVLEWGSGGSTVHFTRFLRECCLDYSWLSLEYNHVWHKLACDEIGEDPRVDVRLFDVGNLRLPQRRTNMDDYVLYPATLERRFNFILVDGRKRRRCLIEASKLIASNGITALHNASREYYQCAFEYFDTGVFLTLGLWVGQVN